MEQLDLYQAKKKQAEQKIIIGGILVVIAVLGWFVVLNEWVLGISIPAGVVGLVFLGIGFSKFSKLNNQFKLDVLGSLVHQEVEDGYYQPDEGLYESQVYQCEFIKRADRYYAEDLIRGKIDGVAFTSSDIKLQERHVEHTKNGTRTRYETYFQGRLFVFQFNKDFNGYVQVLERGRPRSRRKYGKIKLESVQFNKTFKTYTTNDHTAFYVLTPHLMEALMEFEKNNRGNIGFSFIDDKLYIGINNMRDTFELQLFRPVDKRLIDEFKRDLLVVKNVVHELRLNNNIFK
jgi:hypothetical protein